MSLVSGELSFSVDRSDNVPFRALGLDISRYSLLLLNSNGQARLSKLGDDGWDTWRLLLGKDLLEEAHALCSCPRTKRSLATLFADKLFSEKQYERAAVAYSQSDCKVETVILMYMRASCEEGLLIYAESILELYNDQDKKMQ